MTFYGPDLAAIHAASFTQLAEAGAETLLRALIRWKVPGGPVVELACGSGDSGERLTRAGWSVTGYDLSAAMIALARKRAPLAEFHVGDLLVQPLPNHLAAITLLGEALNYPDRDALTAAGGLEGLFRRWYEALAPGGLLLFDVAGPGRGGPGGTYISAREGDGWAVIATTTESLDHRSLARAATIFTAEGARFRRTQELHTLQLYGPDAVLTALDAAGFNAEVLPGYEAHPLPAGWYAYLARKPA